LGVRIAGIQPGYLPWLGYFDQMQRVDAFLIADELPYSSSGWAHRNRIKAPDGRSRWLTLPARPKHGQCIHQVAMEASVPWVRKHMTSLRHFYARGACVDGTLDDIERILDQTATRLVDASIPTIRFIASRLGLTTPLLLSSELGLEARYAARFPEQPGPTHRIVAYMEALGATELLEAEAGLKYLDVGLFESFGLQVKFHLYEHPVYAQLHGRFLSHMSAIDLLLCVGTTHARTVLKSGTLRAHA
jgi:hypothetical protein